MRKRGCGVVRSGKKNESLLVGPKNKRKEGAKRKKKETNNCLRRQMRAHTPRARTQVDPTGMIPSSMYCGSGTITLTPFFHSNACLSRTKSSGFRMKQSSVNSSVAGQSRYWYPPKHPAGWWVWCRRHSKSGTVSRQVMDSQADSQADSHWQAAHADGGVERERERGREGEGDEGCTAPATLQPPQLDTNNSQLNILKRSGGRCMEQRSIPSVRKRPRPLTSVVESQAPLNFDGGSYLERCHRWPCRQHYTTKIPHFYTLRAIYLHSRKEGVSGTFVGSVGAASSPTRICDGS